MVPGAGPGPPPADAAGAAAECPGVPARPGAAPRLRGCCVKTPYGWGLCVRDEEKELHLQVALDWRLRNKRRVVCAVRRRDISSRSFCAVGDCVLTRFGTGVVLGFRHEDGVHRVQLWGPLGRGRSVAFLREDALLSVLPAAVGLAVDTPYGPGTCRAVRFPGGGTAFCGAGKLTSVAGADGVCGEGPREFLVDLNWGAHAVLQPNSLSCPAAVTLPLICCFLDRASDLFKIHSSTLARFREAFQGLGLERLQERLAAQASGAVEVATRLWDEWEAKDAKSMVDSVVDGLKLKADEVLADPQMKEVLGAGIARLNKLVCNARGFDGVWVGRDDRQPRGTIDDAVLRWHWGEESELEIWGADQVSTVLNEDAFKGHVHADGAIEWSDGDVWVRVGPLKGEDGSAISRDATPGEDVSGREARLALVQRSLKDLRRILGGGEGLDGEVEHALSALSRIAATDGEVQRIVGQMEERRTLLLELRGQLLESKTGQVLKEGQSRLAEQLTRLQETAITPQLERVQQRSKRFLTRLATDRKVKGKATELLSAAQARLASKWNDAADPHRGRLEAWVSKVKERIFAQLGSHRELLLESLGGLQLQQVDLSKLVATSWDPVALEAQLERSLVRAVKLSGLESGSGAELLDRFEGANLVAQIPVVQRTYQGILHVLEELGVEVPLPIRKLLEAQAAGHASGGEAWRAAVVGSLDDESVVRGAEVLVKQGEKLLMQCQELKTNKTVARVMEHLESEDIERELLRRLHGLDTQTMLSTAECALTNAQAREQLVSHLKDTCLDFILKILPAIHIEKVAGHDNGCDWEINNISFSDFSFRKENVHIALGNPAMAGEELLRVSAWDISAHFRGLKVTVKQTSIPYLQAECVADAKAERMSVAFSFRLLPPGTVAAGAAGTGSPAAASAGGAAAEGAATASNNGSGGSLAGGTPPGGPAAPGDSAGAAPAAAPMLAFSSRSVLMDSLELWVMETNYAVIVNALSFLFADVLKNYACQRIAKHLDEHMGTLVNGLNAVLLTCAPYMAKLGFALPLPAVSRSLGSLEAISNVPGPMAAVERPGSEDEAPPCVRASAAVAVPRLGGRGGGRVDGLPEEIDWSDPGRAFAVRA